MTMMMSNGDESWVFSTSPWVTLMRKKKKVYIQRERLLMTHEEKSMKDVSWHGSNLNAGFIFSLFSLGLGGVFDYISELLKIDVFNDLWRQVHG